MSPWLQMIGINLIYLNNDFLLSNQTPNTTKTCFKQRSEEQINQWYE